MSFLSTLQANLGLIPTLVSAIQAFQEIGHSQETTVQKIGQIVEVAAAVGEVVPVPQVAAVSSLIESIAQQIFNPPKPAATPPVPATT